MRRFFFLSCIKKPTVWAVGSCVVLICVEGFGLVAEADAELAGFGDPGVVEGDGFPVAGDFGEGDGDGVGAFGGDHDAEGFVMDELCGG